MTTQAFPQNPFLGLDNPFAPAPAPFARASLATEPETQREPSFALAKNGPPVPENEVESHVDAIEVTVRWGEQVLAVKHLKAGESFFVGEGTEIALPETNGKSAVVVSRKEGVGHAAYLVVPRGAKGVATFKGGHVAQLEEGEIALGAGTTVMMDVGAITFEVSTVRAGKVAPIGFLAALAGGATGFIGLSFLGHAAIVASMAMFMPKMGPDDAEALDREQILKMQTLLDASAIREQDKQPEQQTATREDSGGGSTGAPHKGESGEAGTTKPVSTNGHMGLKGQEKESQLSKKEEMALAADFGMIGMLRGAANMDPNAPASPWANEFKGSDEKSAMGKMFGQSIDDAAGYGLGLWGTGEGGGGTADVIGLDHVNTVGGGGGGTGKWGIGPGDKDGLGNGHGPGNGGHKAKAPIMREVTTVTSGGLPADTIQRIVRQNFGRFRLCYEAGLRTNPALTGRVVTKFVIARDGTVQQAFDGGSDMPDKDVTACVVRGYANLSFPAAGEGGITTVSYPIMFQPGE